MLATPRSLLLALLSQLLTKSLKNSMLTSDDLVLCR
jgi:hypothetical protein